MTALARSRRNERGFTLVELLVAVVAGLFVVLAAFLLSKGSTKLFADENRVGTAQLNLRLGLDRLRSDLARAGFMTSPNVATDPDVCPDPNKSGFIARLQSVYYERGGSYLGTKAGSDLNGLSPDAITLTGNFAGTDSYLASSVETSAAGGYDVFLQRNFGAMQRLLSAGDSGTTQSVLDATFPAGKVIRIQNPLGSSQFMVIDTVAMASTVGGDAPKIHLRVTPTLRTVIVGNPDKRCGITGYGLGSTVNSVQFVKYDLRNLSTLAPWAYPDPVADAIKYDLIRTELNPDGSEITTAPVPTSIVAEYVVDMKFAFTIDEGTVSGGLYREPLLKAYPFDDAAGVAAASDILAGGGTAKPQRIRSIRFQITTRGREPDRSTSIGATGTGLLRYAVAPNQYARARTDVGEITLVNQRSIQW
ncbi:MAG: prepilin-type N-terminal cleavage/methylation domain-containing protein [Polyangiales bacterium]